MDHTSAPVVRRRTPYPAAGPTSRRPLQCGPRRGPAGCRPLSCRACRRGLARADAKAPQNETRGGVRVRSVLSRTVILAAVLLAAVPVTQAAAAQLGERTP